MDSVSSVHRDAKAQAHSRMHYHQEAQSALPSKDFRLPSLSHDAHIPSPFAQLGVQFTDSELRETAYEIVIGACRSSGSGRPLKFVSNSERNGLDRSDSISSSSSQSLQRSLTSSAASKVKKALGLKSKKKDRSDSAAADQTQNSATRKRASTVGELMRAQMKVSEQTDSRVRRGLLRVAAGQVSKDCSCD